MMDDCDDFVEDRILGARSSANATFKEGILNDSSENRNSSFIPIKFNDDFESDYKVEPETVDSAIPFVVQEVQSDLYDDGYQKGYEDGIAAGKTQQNELRLEEQNRFGEFFGKFQEQLQRALSKIELDALELSLSIAERVAFGLTTENRDYLTKVLNLYLKEIAERELVRVKVSLKDHEILEGYMPKSHHIKLIATEEVKSGVIVETNSIKLNGDLASMIESVRIAMGSVLKQ